MRADRLHVGDYRDPVVPRSSRRANLARALQCRFSGSQGLCRHGVRRGFQTIRQGVPGYLGGNAARDRGKERHRDPGGLSRRTMRHLRDARRRRRSRHGRRRRSRSGIASAGLSVALCRIWPGSRDARCVNRRIERQAKSADSPRLSMAGISGPPAGRASGRRRGSIKTGIARRRHFARSLDSNSDDLRRHCHQIRRSAVVRPEPAFFGKRPIYTKRKSSWELEFSRIHCLKSPCFWECLLNDQLTPHGRVVRTGI